jgi:tail lysozyme
VTRAARLVSSSFTIRWDDLKHWAAANKKDWKDPDSQVAFALQELQNKYPALSKQLMSANSAEEAEQLFKDIYERPAGTKLTAGERFLTGATDPLVGGGQLLGKMTEAPKGYTQADVDLINKGLIAAGLPPTASLPGDLDRAVKEREITYQDRRGPNPGADGSHLSLPFPQLAPVSRLFRSL